MARGDDLRLLPVQHRDSLIVEASARPRAAPAIVRRAVRLTVLLLSPGIALIVLGAPLFMSVTLGAHYAHYGTRVLQLLALALPFTAINALYITFARLARRMRRVAVIQICITAISSPCRCSWWDRWGSRAWAWVLGGSGSRRDRGGALGGPPVPSSDMAPATHLGDPRCTGRTRDRPPARRECAACAEPAPSRGRAPAAH